MKSSKHSTVLGYLKIREANSFLKRLKGLLFERKLDVSECMIIDPCNSVHTLGMKYSIHVIFLKKDYTIVKIINNLEPNRFSVGTVSTCKVVEFSSDFPEISESLIGKKFIENEI